MPLLRQVINLYNPITHEIMKIRSIKQGGVEEASEIDLARFLF